MTHFIGKNSALLLTAIVFCVILLMATTPAVAQSVTDSFTQTMFEVAGKLFGWFADSVLRIFFDISRSIFLETFNFTIIEFGNHWSTGGGFDGLSAIWVIFRDLVNIVIVILFIFSSILTILSENAFGINRTKALIALLGAAVFVNFSGYIAFFLIDLSHVFLIIFGDQVFDANRFAQMDVFEEEINLAIGLSTLPAENVFSLLYSFSKMVVYTFLSAGFFFFSILLIERFLFAIVLILTSPIAFLGFFVKRSGLAVASPGSYIARAYDEWSKRFSHIATVPLVMILGLTIVLYIYEGVFREVLKSVGVDKVLIDDVASASEASGAGVTKMLVGTTIANALLIYGFFKVYAMAKSTYVYRGGLRVGKRTATIGKGLARSIPIPKAVGSRLENKFKEWSTAHPTPGSVKSDIGRIGLKAISGARKTAEVSKQAASVGRDTKDFSKAIWDGGSVQEVIQERGVEEEKKLKESLSEARKPVDGLQSRINSIEQMIEFFENTTQGGHKITEPKNIPAGHPSHSRVVKSWNNRFGGTTTWKGAFSDIRRELGRVRKLENVDNINTVLNRQERLAKLAYNLLRTANQGTTTAKGNPVHVFDKKYEDIDAKSNWN